MDPPSCKAILTRQVTFNLLGYLCVGLVRINGLIFIEIFWTLGGSGRSEQFSTWRASDQRMVNLRLQYLRRLMTPPTLYARDCSSDATSAMRHFHSQDCTTHQVYNTKAGYRVKSQCFRVALRAETHSQNATYVCSRSEALIHIEPALDRSREILPQSCAICSRSPFQNGSLGTTTTNKFYVLFYSMFFFLKGAKSASMVDMRHIFCNGSRSILHAACLVATAFVHLFDLLVLTFHQSSEYSRRPWRCTGSSKVGFVS
jgi:hypothetical protein